MNDQFYRELSDATLEVVEIGQFAQVFCLRKYPGQYLMSTYLIFTPFSVIITGDNAVEAHGVQAMGRGLDWFKQKTGGDYLAQNFLETRWVPDLARSHWQHILETWRGRQEEWQAELKEMTDDLDAEDRELWEDPDPKSPELKRRTWRVGGEELDDVTVVEALEALLDPDQIYFSSPDRLWDCLPAYEEERSGEIHSRSFLCPFDTDDVRGYGYPEAKVGWLEAIHRRFVELYAQVESELGVSREKNPA